LFACGGPARAPQSGVEIFGPSIDTPRIGASQKKRRTKTANRSPLSRHANWVAGHDSMTKTPDLDRPLISQVGRTARTALVRVYHGSSRRFGNGSCESLIAASWGVSLVESLIGRNSLKNRSLKSVTKRIDWRRLVSAGGRECDS